MEGATFNSDEVNFLIYRYMLENGFQHTAFTFGAESNVTNTTIDGSAVPRGALISIIQKGVHFTEAEFFAALASIDSAAVDARLYESNLSTMSLLESVLPDAERMKALERKVVDELGADVCAHRPPNLHLVYPPRPTSEASALSSPLSSEVDSLDGMEEENEEADAPMPSSSGAATAAAPATAASTSAAATSIRAEPSLSGGLLLGAGRSELNGLPIGYEQQARGRGGGSEGDETLRRFYANGSSITGQSGKLKAAAHTRLNGVNARASSSEVPLVYRNNKLLPELPGCDINPDLELDRNRVIVLDGHARDAFVCSWCPRTDGAYIASGSGDGTARIWRVADEVDGWTRNTPVDSVVLTHNQLLPHSKDVTAIDWDNRGEQLATGCYAGIARVWDRSGQLLSELSNLHKGPIFALRFDPSGTHILSAGVDRSTIVWNPQTGHTDKFDFHESSALDVDWIDEQMFVSCSVDRAIYLCQLGRHEPLKRFHVCWLALRTACSPNDAALKGHQNEINAVRYDPNSQRLASCSDDKTLKVWSLHDETPLLDIPAHEKEIHTIRWAPSGWRIASASLDTSIRIWDIEKQTRTLDLLKHTEVVYSVAFSPDGRQLASGSEDQTVNLWDVNTGAVVLTYTGNAGVFDLSYKSSGDRLAASCGDGTVLLFDLRFMSGK